MFFEGNDVFVSLPTGYGKSLIYQAAPVIDRLSSLDESGHYIYCAARQSSQRRPGALSQCTWAKRIVRLQLSVSLRTVLRGYQIKASCFFRRFFRQRKESLFLHACSVTISDRNLVKL